MTDVDLRQLAVAYLTAVHDHQPPTRAVQEEFGFTRSDTGRYIRAARDAGLLPPITKGQATPAEGHWPRSAKLLNNRDMWVVCLTCHQPWPCPAPDTLHWIDTITGEHP